MPDNLYQRNGIWWARFKVDGVEYRRSLRTRVLSDAKKKVKKAKSSISDEVHFGIAVPQTWKDAVVDWKVSGTTGLGAKTVQRYLCSLKQMRPFLDHLMVADVTGPLLKQIVTARKAQGVTNASIRRDLTAISSVLDNAADEDSLEGNPVLAFLHRRRKKSSLKEKRDPIVLPGQASIEIMLATSPSRFADAQEWARECGMREAEIFGLTHSQLCAADGVIKIVGKGNKLRVIPYTPRLREIAERQPQFLGSRYVFWHSEGARWQSPGSRFGDIKRRVAQKAAREGVAFVPYRFHDLRHLFAVEFLAAGKGSIYDLKELLGHKSMKTTEQYLEHLTPEQKKVAMHGVAQEAARKQRSGER